jgi:hypothetical protein
MSAADETELTAAAKADARQLLAYDRLTQEDRLAIAFLHGANHAYAHCLAMRASVDVIAKAKTP